MSLVIQATHPYPPPLPGVGARTHLPHFFCCGDCKLIAMARNGAEDQDWKWKMALKAITAMGFITLSLVSVIAYYLQSDRTEFRTTQQLNSSAIAQLCKDSGVLKNEQEHFRREMDSLRDNDKELKSDLKEIKKYMEQRR